MEKEDVMEETKGLSRKQFLGAAAATAGAAAGAATLAKVAPSAFANSPRIPAGRRGIILFTIRDRISASATSAGSAEGVPYGFVQCFERLREIGYRTIEFAGYNQSTSILGRQITAAEIRTALDNAGLEANGSHGTIPSTITETTLTAFDNYCNTAATIGQSFIGTGNDPTSSSFVADWDAACERWNILGERAKVNFGLKLYTHNHDAAYNFLLDSGPLDTLGRPTRSSGIRRLEYFLKCTDKRYVHLEMDVYWAHVAQHRFREYTNPDGVLTEDIFDPAGLVSAEGNSQRYTIFHFKDGARTADPPGVGSGYTFVPFGTGDIDFADFCDRIGQRNQKNPNWEQDNAPGGSANPGQSFQFAEISYANMAAL
jgi:sugar phosphate isomerase/epimerase